MLAAKSWTFNLLLVAMVEVEGADVADEDVGNAEIDGGGEVHDVCFGSFGMQVGLLSWNTGACSSRAFGTASRLPSLVKSIRKSFKTRSWPAQAFISRHSALLLSSSAQATISCFSSSSTIWLRKGFSRLDSSGSLCGPAEQL